MREEDSIYRNVDWLTIMLYALLVTAGWLNIYAADYNPIASQSIFNFDINAGKQLVWIATALVLIIIPVFILDYKFYSAFSYIIYGLIIFLLIATIFFGTEVKGSKSWFEIGTLRLQPAEFSKFATALALSAYLGQINVKFEHLKTKLIALAIICLPAALIRLQNETGVMLVFAAFILVLFRQGLSPWVLILGFVSATLFVVTLILQDKILIMQSLAIIGAIIIVTMVAFSLLRRKNIKIKKILVRAGLIAGFCVACMIVVFSVDMVYNKLEPHQQKRIMILFNPESDPKGAGYNIKQSKIAIGSGEFIGKGYLQGTQTKLKYVPEQSTDFIFCTVGEEHGWIGSSMLILLYLFFMMRLIFLAERQRDKFAKTYGYCVACIIFIHFTINIGMTIGILPVVGIPLPFFSYGGSSLWSFTILVFIFLKLDAHRRQVLGH
ncbi:MAG: rod shape-determining protein RodA [Cytophagaceae bacterium]|nr:rod shape-determining protein RodA [Cytophagaceae bacterium]